MRLCGESIQPGQKRHIALKISETITSDPIRIPLTVIRGKKPGPTGFVFAALHGNEINGIDIVRRLIYEADHSDLRGTIIAVPILNVPGFHSQSRYLPEHRDLNRYFPGCRRGNNAQQIAHQIFNLIVKKCDFGVDLHTAGEGRTNVPHVRGDLRDPLVRELARSSGAAILIDAPGEYGTLRRAATESGVPTILFEAGEPKRFDPRVSKAGLMMLLNLLTNLGMHSPDRELGLPFVPPFQVSVRSRKWIRAHHGGILDVHVSPGDLVYRDDIVATILNPFGKLRKHLRSDRNGIVLGTTVHPIATPGTGIVHVAELKQSLKRVERVLADDRISWKRAS